MPYKVRKQHRSDFFSPPFLPHIPKQNPGRGKQNCRRHKPSQHKQEIIILNQNNRRNRDDFKNRPHQQITRQKDDTRISLSIIPIPLFRQKISRNLPDTKRDRHKPEYEIDNLHHLKSRLSFLIFPSYFFPILF